MTDYKALEHEYGVPLQAKRDLVAVRGSGALLYDEQDREYIDCAAGSWSPHSGIAIQSWSQRSSIRPKP